VHFASVSGAGSGSSGPSTTGIAFRRPFSDDPLKFRKQILRRAGAELASIASAARAYFNEI
jgi:hypothetical protein